jgi:hypothetical protein
MINTNTSDHTIFKKGNIVYVGNRQILPVKIVMDKNEFTIPCKTFDDTVEQRKNQLITIQTNNQLVALSTLKSAVGSFLRFESSFKTLLSSGDDQTQINILKQCIKELETANESFDVILKGDPLKWLIVEPSYRCDIRELFEHCIKVLIQIIPLLGGRYVNYNSYEYISQTYGWIGWQQQSELINISNNVLKFLLDKISQKYECEGFITDTHIFLLEIRAFSDVVSHMTDSFLKKQYPSYDTIINIYEKHKITDINHYLSHHKQYVDEQQRKLTEGNKKSGFFY